MSKPIKKSQLIKGPPRALARVFASEIKIGRRDSDNHEFSDFS